MRPTLILALLSVSLVFASTGFALDTDKGRIVQGLYFASGKASVAGVKVQYLRSKARVTILGQIKGGITKVIISQGQTLSSTRLRLRGHVNSLSRHNGSFTASATIKLSDGVVVSGEFQGLIGQPPSRFFRGKIKGDAGSNFLLRSR
jgi:hypothetical protein